MVIALIILLVLAFLYYMFPIIQVCGDSMYPTLKDGDILLGCRFFKIDIGSIYVYTPPDGEKYVIKRLIDIESNQDYPNMKRLFFEGDNSEHSYDSRMYGYVRQDRVVAKCIFTIHRRKEKKSNDGK